MAGSPYTVQCRDASSQAIGDFVFDRGQAEREGVFRAVSPIFKSLMDLFRWARENGVALDHNPFNFPAPRTA